jgi:RNA polymerase sigma-70 factor (ECF subfamily)
VVFSKEASMTATQPRAGAPAHGIEFTTELAALRRSLYQRALFLTQDRTAADDLAQATMERALIARDRYQSGTNLRAWLLLMMRNLFIDGRRRAVFQAGALDEECASALPDTAPGPLDLLCGDDVAQATALLCPEHREVFTLAYVDHLSYREIGARLGITANATGGRLLRARTRLRVLLDVIFERRLDDVVKGRAAAGRRHATAG